MSEDHEEKKGGRHKGVAAPQSLPGEVPEREAALLMNRFRDKMTIADATLQAGYQCGSRHSANVLGGQIIRKHRDANSELIQALERHGVTLEKVATVIQEGLSGEMPAKQGSTIVMVPDHRTRHQFAETALDIAGARAPKQITLESRTYEQKLSIIAELKAAPEEGIARILALLKQKRGI